VTTIFSGDEDVERDSEAYKIWLNYLKKERIFEFGKRTTSGLWEMLVHAVPVVEIHYFKEIPFPAMKNFRGENARG